MKPLFICNPSQVLAIKKHIEDNKIFKSVKTRDLDHCFITSQTECDKRRSDFIGIGDAPFTRLYIDPFLEWGKEDYYGYHIALDILTNWKKKEAPGLVFLSAIEQKGFDKLVKGKLNSFVREFIHFDFLDLKDKCLPYSTFSTSRWKYLKAYALTSSGILDDLSHDLTTIISQKESSRNSLEKLISRVKNLPETVGTEVLQECNSYQDDVNVSAFAKALQDKIQNRIKEIKPHEPSAIEIPANLNILIVEDNEEHLAVLEKTLTEREGYFKKDKNLHSFTNGAAALKELKKSPNEFQLVLVDLRLNDDNGFAQAVHGVDIIEELQKNHPMSSYTIITGMGRKGIGELLDIDVKFILSKKNLYSFDTESEVDKMLTRMIDDVSQREKSNHYNFGPNKTIYGWAMFKSNLFALGKERIQEQISIANNKLKLFVNKELNEVFEIPGQKQQGKFDMAAIDSVHINILSLRRIFIWLALKNYNRLYLSNEEQGEYQEVLDNNGIKINKSRVDAIGLHYKSIKTDKDIPCFKLELDKLWPHEQVIVNEWNEEHNEVFIDSLQDIVVSEKHPSLYKFILAHLSYEKEDFKFHIQDVPLDTSIWNFKDLGNFLAQVFNDYSENGENSFHYPKVESMLNDEFVYNYFEQQIAPYLPKIDEKFMEL